MEQDNANIHQSCSLNKTKRGEQFLLANRLCLHERASAIMHASIHPPYTKGSTLYDLLPNSFVTFNQHVVKMLTTCGIPEIMHSNWAILLGNRDASAVDMCLRSRSVPIIMSIRKWRHDQRRSTPFPSGQIQERSARRAIAIISCLASIDPCVGRRPTQTCVVPFLMQAPDRVLFPPCGIHRTSCSNLIVT